MSRIVLFTAAALVATLNFNPVPAQDTTGLGEAFMISRGGQLYDKWWVSLKATKPEEVHPAYPEAGQKSGADTWRCKECHGWDYNGAQGAYGTGSHFTGIKGITGMAGADPAKIIDLLRAAPHGYTPDILPEVAVLQLAMFVSKGQVDPSPFVVDGKPKGDLAAGKTYFENICSGCHGLDGKKIKDADPLGAVSGNTVEMMHKVLNGQPAEAMPALRVLDPQIAADIVVYLQTLPE